MDFKQKERQSFSFKTTEDKKESFASEFRQDVGELNVERSKTLNINDTAELFRKEFDTISEYKAKNADESLQVLPKESPAEPKYIGMEKCFAEKQEGDSDRMLKIRTALKTYHDYMDEHKGTNGLFETWSYLNNIVKACKSYRFLRFSIFKRGEAKKRLEEVIALQEKVTVMAEDAHTEMWQAGISDDNTMQGFNKGDQKEGDLYVFNNRERNARRAHDQKLRDGTSNFQKVLAGGAAILGFLIYNPIRLVGAAVTLPVWAINEGIRAVERKVTGGWAHRPIKMGWKWSPNGLAMSALEKLYNLNDHYLNLGERDLNAGDTYYPSLDSFKNLYGVKINKKASTIEYKHNEKTVKYRVTFNQKAQKNVWYEINEKDGTERRLGSDDSVMINESVKITKNKVALSNKKKDIEKRMQEEMSEFFKFEDGKWGMNYDDDDDDD